MSDEQAAPPPEVDANTPAQPAEDTQAGFSLPADGQSGSQPSTSDTGADAAAAGDTVQEAAEAVADAAEGGELSEDLELNLHGKVLKFKKGTQVDEIYPELRESVDNLTKGFSKKAEETAAIKAEWEATSTTLQRMAGLTGEKLQAAAELQRLAAEKQKFDQVTPQQWQQLAQQDPQRARDLSWQRQQIDMAFGQANNFVAQIDEEISRAERESVAEREKKALEELPKKIPGFNAEAVRKHLQDERGLTENVARSVLADPVSAEVVWEAMEYRRIQKETAKASKQKPPPAQPTKPVSGRASTSGPKDLRNVKNVDEFFKLRTAQLRANRA